MTYLRFGLESINITYNDHVLFCPNLRNNSSKDNVPEWRCFVVCNALHHDCHVSMIAQVTQLILHFSDIFGHTNLCWAYLIF